MITFFFFSYAAASQDGDIYTNATASGAPASYVQVAQHQRGQRLALSQLDQTALVEKHNALRAAVSQPCTAADMEALAWDDSLASAAQNYAAQCKWQHDTTNADHGWGENLAMRYSTINGELTNTVSTELLTGFAQAWYDEVIDANWAADGEDVTSKVYADPARQCKSYDAHTGKCMVGHFTQVVWAKTNKVGCGVASCSHGLQGKGGVILVCKYTPAGNYVGKNKVGILPPYIAGASCSACPSSCSKGTLCDAGHSPNRCRDDIDGITAMNFNSVPHTDCKSLITFTNQFGPNFWCSSRESKFSICAKSCGVCSVPNGFGPRSCGAKVKTSGRPVAAPGLSMAAIGRSVFGTGADEEALATELRTLSEWASSLKQTNLHPQTLRR